MSKILYLPLTNDKKEMEDFLQAILDKLSELEDRIEALEP